MIPTNPTTEPLAQHIPLDVLTPHARNYNAHPADQIARLRVSLRTYGQPRPIVVHRGVILAGHGVYAAARAEGWRQIWCSIAPDYWTEAQAIGYLVADNETRRGAEPDEMALLQLIEETRHEVGLEALGFDEGALQALRDEVMAADANGILDPVLPPTLTAKDKRKPCVDVIYTFSSSKATCCIAHHSGLMYGVRSTDKPCDRHPLHFIDNEFKDYDHEHHKRFVATYQPKYATVMDIFTPEQSRVLGIEHHGFDKVMRWAEEMEGYTENVIVIPKYDCIDDIPERFMVGYSIPTSYGGTPLPIERFSKRRVHLLGGSPKRQYQYWAAISDSVVSVDTNYIDLLSQMGQMLNLDIVNDIIGTSLPHRDQVLISDIGLTHLPNPFYVAFAINAGYYLALFSNPPIPVSVNPDQTLEQS